MVQQNFRCSVLVYHQFDLLQQVIRAFNISKLNSLIGKAINRYFLMKVRLLKKANNRRYEQHELLVDRSPESGPSN
ncbi:unnamed protein product [Trifolium pratense]|uniref:Uncharacterized protein n=1 Tax=Trifolium pratense TaxID=57577 RepID=A0ACB0LP34_TRIPR|nr:unnamed protein product [Trifolium pratense]